MSRVIYFESTPTFIENIKGFFTGVKRPKLTKFQLMLKSYRECQNDAELMALYAILHDAAKNRGALYQGEYTQTDEYDPRWPTVLCSYKIKNTKTNVNMDIRFNHVAIDGPIHASHVRLNQGLFYSFCGDYNIFQNLLQKISGAQNYLRKPEYISADETVAETMKLARQLKNQKQH